MTACGVASENFQKWLSAPVFIAYSAIKIEYYTTKKNEPMARFFDPAQLGSMTDYMVILLSTSATLRRARARLARLLSST